MNFALTGELEKNEKVPKIVKGFVFFMYVFTRHL